MDDPNPVVTGGGNDFLRACGIEVQDGVLEEECRALNRPFIKHSTTGLPWVTMKAGMSLDARISFRQGKGERITGKESRLFTHRLRNTADAILIGIGTALIDDPSLTCRLPPGEAARDPLRIIVDSRLRLSAAAKVVSQESTAPTWIYCSTDPPQREEQALVAAGVSVYRTGALEQNRLDLVKILEHLGKCGITSVLVEGGAAIHGDFLRRGLVDEVYLFVAPILIGGCGTPLVAGTPCFTPDSAPRLRAVQVTPLGADILWHGLMGPALP
jgi:diaminohydroxyphosphoribosylaminopyrimidine deaminase/5-amino-6-(5-phosphoribosylamino)uracil reductase